MEFWSLTLIYQSFTYTCDWQNIFWVKIVMGSKINIEEGGHEDNEVAEILLKFKGQISNLPEEFGTLNLQEGVQRFDKNLSS